MTRTTTRVPAGLVCAAAVWVAVLAAGCSTAPGPDGAANAAAAAAGPSVTGSLAQWQDAVCRVGTEVDSGTRQTVEGTTCLPTDGDGIVNFDHFESEPSMASVLSWRESTHVAEAVVDGLPLAIWTPSGEAGDLEPLKQFGFRVASHQSVSFARQSANLPATLPAGDVETIPPNQLGYVVVQTAAGDTQCIVETTFIGCQTEGTNWAQHVDGSGPYHGVRVNADGTGSWVDGNLGAAAPTSLANKTYRALGWTIVSSPSGMRFTNDKTRHGAVVSSQSVATF